MFEFLYNYWWVLLIVIIVVGFLISLIIDFFKSPTSAQITAIKQWLLYAVTEAEKQFGSGTGKLKLSYVYDLFLSKFPYLGKVVGFEWFSSLVDIALDNFKDILSNNKAIRDYVNPEEKNEEQEE